MKEDIKILEELKEHYKSRINTFSPFGENAKRKYQALENLLKGYRELKIVLNQLIKQNEQLKFENQMYVNKLHYVIPPQKNNYIPKSKIKEKIKELYEDKDNKYYDMFLEQRDIEKTISILQELMEEK